ncbi:MAG: DNA-processing protein DprA [Demequinaceae bacterium]|nr:DNA-processing protein DprA [Demequinaceae bacterium]
MSECDRRALVAWSAIAEPGDAVAHALVGILGPGEALSWARKAVDDPVGASFDLSMPRHLTDRAVASAERWGRRREAWDADQHLGRAEKVGARVVARGDPEWPDELDDLGDAQPYCLWVRGSADIRQAWSRSVAIVGSRSSTAYGEHVAATLAAHLADEGHTVVSGGAYGIDARAHRGAVAAGGVTVAVMAGGVDRLYPVGNANLLAWVLESGAIVGELPPGYAPHRSRFLTRNRIIAAAHATVVVEAAHRSGALSTAFHAAGLGRPVAAVPGPVTSPGSAGCHRLIRDGAILVTGAGDVLDLVRPLDAAREAGSDGEKGPKGGAMTFATPDQRRAYDAVSRKGSTVGEVAAEAGLGMAEARSALGGLLLAGSVVRDGVEWRRSPR